MATAAYYLAFCAACISVLKEVNIQVTGPYMDEPFHVPQAQAYCRGDFLTWDPKITTPPGLYIMSVILKRIFLFKCTLPMLRLTTLITLLILPLVLTRLLCFYKREYPPQSIMNPSMEAIVMSAFPLAWFYGFLYYTEVPSLVFVIGTVMAAGQDQHWLAALLGLISCTFRQNNVIWVLYAYASSQLMYLRFRRAEPGTTSPSRKLHDPPALSAGLVDFVKSILSFPYVIPDILPACVPYALLCGLFAAFVFWNGGIVLGDKSNHIPALHIPQVYYCIACATAFGWPVLLTDPAGPKNLAQAIWRRMFGGTRRGTTTIAISVGMAVTIKLFTIHHPFLLSDNRHYTFYLWRRVYLFHPVVPYLLIPVYIACAWAWFLRVGRDKTLLQTLLLPIFVIPTLLPTPLLEPRYFLVPYILLRSQITDVTPWGMALEAIWYVLVNGVTMGVFLYLPREGDIRFMW